MSPAEVLLCVLCLLTGMVAGIAAAVYVRVHARITKQQRQLHQQQPTAANTHAATSTAVDDKVSASGSEQSTATVSDDSLESSDAPVPIARRLAQADGLHTRLGTDVSGAVDIADGEEFAQRVSCFPDALPDGGKFEGTRWQLMVSAEVPGSLSHRCYRHVFDDDSTTYLSESIVENASPEQVVRFYLADEERHHWDDTYHHGELVRTDSTTGAEVLYYVRNFPVMCAPRDYVFSRRTFVKGDSYVTVSKACDVPEKPPEQSPGVKRVERYESSWSCKRVLGQDNEFTATQVLLYHYEDQKLPQNVARLAVRHGMWPQVRKCFVSGFRNYVREGRDNEFSKSLRGMPRLEHERSRENEAPAAMCDETASDASSDSATQSEDNAHPLKRKGKKPAVPTPLRNLAKRKRFLKRGLGAAGTVIGCAIALKCGACVTVRYQSCIPSVLLWVELVLIQSFACFCECRQLSWEVLANRSRARSMNDMPR